MNIGEKYLAVIKKAGFKVSNEDMIRRGEGAVTIYRYDPIQEEDFWVLITFSSHKAFVKEVAKYAKSYDAEERVKEAIREGKEKDISLEKLLTMEKWRATQLRWLADALKSGEDTVEISFPITSSKENIRDFVKFLSAEVRHRAVRNGFQFKETDILINGMTLRDYLKEENK